MVPHGLLYLVAPLSGLTSEGVAAVEAAGAAKLALPAAKSR